MPDITLYADDAETIIQALWAQKTAIRNRATKVIIPEEDYNLMQQLERVADKMVDRVAQGLHPIKRG